jgi:glutamate/tyrosine decarboxylase-like PLP-dependent enzyme
VQSTPELELAAPVPLNVVCFRHRGPAGLDGEARDGLNRDLLVRLQQGGEAVPSGTVIDGRFALRAAITNHRSRRDDFDRLVAATLRAADEVLDARAARRA